MNRTRIRVFARNRMSVKTLPIQSFRRPGAGVESWMQAHRAMTGHHPITGIKMNDKELSQKVMKANQQSVERRNNVGREFSERDTEIHKEMIIQANMRILGQEND